MIIRRAAKAIKNQDWVVILIEFLLVVLGVWIALQVDEWQKDADEKSLQKGYLIRLQEDFEGSLAALSALSGFHQIQIDNLKLVADTIETCSLPADKQNQFTLGLFHMGKINDAPFIKRTINEMQSSGGFRLLESGAVKSAINAAVSEADQTIQVHKSLLERVTPAVNRAYQRFRFEYPNPDSGPQPDWGDLKIDLDALCGDQDFINDLHYVRNNLSNMQRFFSRRENVYKDTINFIQADLKDRFKHPSN